MKLDEAEAKSRKLMDLHGLEEWSFSFDRAVKRAGICYGKRQHISLSKALTEVRSEEEVTMTILHEIAHALVGVNEGHGAVWRHMYISLGGNGRTAYVASEAVEQFQNSRIKYTTVCDHCGADYSAMRRLSKFSERYCSSKPCANRNRIKSSRTYLVWFENTKFGPVRAHD